MDAGVRDVMLVAVGGAAGSALRYGVGRLMGPTVDAVFPWHTFLINATGAFAIGLLLVAAARLGLPGWWRPLLAVGLLGGYTTFSTFALETVELALRGSYATAGAYALGSVAVGLAAAAAGIFLGRAVL
jgi:fluoride exporter